jgi:uncharacterized membrane protein
MSGIFLIVSTFLASSLEAVEVMAIILGVGATRGWRATLVGVGVGLAVLAGVIVVLGAALTNIPIAWLRIFVGTLLLIFGMQWLVKGVVRVGQSKDLIAAPPGEAPGQEQGPSNDTEKVQGFDWTAFVLALKGVVLEGLEVSFIVVTFGAEADQIPLAGASATAAVVIVAAIALVARRWVESIPRPWLRWGVGIMLVSFGTFWASEGIGVEWPGGDLSIAGLLAAYVGVSLAYIWLIRSARFPGVGTNASGASR